MFSSQQHFSKVFSRLCDCTLSVCLFFFSESAVKKKLIEVKRSQIITSMHFIKQSNWMEELCLEGLYCGLPSVRAEGRFCVLTIRNDVTAAQALAHVHNYCSFLFVDATSSYGAFSLEFLLLSYSPYIGYPFLG